MYLNRNVINKQQGLGLPSALFLILVLILLISAMNQLNDANANIYSREWLSQRAFYAAESGAQLSAVYVLNDQATLPNCNNNYISNFSFSNSGLSQCTVTVVCRSQIVSSDTFYTLTSTGTCGTGLEQANRIIQIRVKP